MDPSSQFIVPTIIDVPELIVTNEDIDFDDSTGLAGDLWLNKLQFLTSALSYTVGLGNLWRFPYLCYKYAGGAFLVAYSLVLLAVGLPLFLMELAFGQYANEGPITIWRISPAFEGIGYTMCLISALVAIYYNLVNTWIVHYLFASVTFGTLPWASCDNSWNSARCFLRPDTPTESLRNCTQIGLATTTATSGNVSQVTSELNATVTSNASSIPASNCSSFEKIINSTSEVTLPANEYFHNQVLEITSSLAEVGGLNWNLLFGLVIVWAAVFSILLKNLRLSNRLAKVGLLMPYLMLTTLFARAISLEGAGDGISYYFTVKWPLLNDIGVWSDATTQIFFSLSPCWGGIITLASMNKFHNNFHANTMSIVSINYLTSMYSGLVSFAILGFMSNYSGIALEEVATSGLGFVFMVYTEALAKLPLANLNSLIFFATLLFLGLASQLTVIETVVTTIIDTWPHKLRYRKPLVLMILCTIMFVTSFFMCFGNGFYLMQLMDTFAGTFTAMLIGILELIAIAWVYGMDNFMQDIDDMISVHRNLFPSRLYWYFLWRYLTPSLLFSILIFSITDFREVKYRDYQFPGWSTKFGWIVTLVCVSIIPAIALVRFILSPGGSFTDKINYLLKPSEDWAPSSYVSGPKLLNRHMMDDSDLLDDSSSMMYSPSQRPTHNHHQPYTDQDQESNESNEDLKVVDGRANYIIPEEEDDTDTGLITNETNV